MEYQLDKYMEMYGLLAETEWKGSEAEDKGEAAVWRHARIGVGLKWSKRDIECLDGASETNGKENQEIVPI